MHRSVVVILLAIASACSGSGAVPAGAPPERFVGVTADGSVVVARTADGSVERTIMGRAPKGETRRIELLDDGETLYVWTGTLGGCGSLTRTTLGGGSSTTVLDRVRAWSVSGDGRSIAWTEGPYLGLDQAACEEALTVVARGPDGTERRWTRHLDPEGYPAGVVELLWAAPPRYLAWTSCGADACWPSVLDTTREGTLDEATERPVTDEGSSLPGLGYDWFPSSVVMRGDGGTMVFSVDRSSSDGTETDPVVEADAMTGRPIRILFDAPGGPLDFDASGAHLLFRHERLARWSAREGLIEIGGGFVHAQW